MFAIFTLLFGSLIAALMYGWLNLLGYSVFLIKTVMIIELLCIIITAIYEQNASKTSGASGWLSWVFIVFNVLAAFGFGGLKMILWFFSLF